MARVVKKDTHVRVTVKIKTWILQNVVFKLIKPQWAHSIVISLNDFRKYNFMTIKNYPKKITGFHDLVYLFNPDVTQRYIRMTIDEAAYLYKFIKANDIKVIAEIGRFMGGSTVLLASTGARVISIDSKIGFPEYARDDLLERHLSELGLGANCKLVVHESATYDPKCELDMVVIDGSHEYEDVKNDFRNYDRYLKKGGHMLFHNSVDKTYIGKMPGVAKAISEIKGYETLATIGSFTHMKKMS